jgi:hypothetical protein
MDKLYVEFGFKGKARLKQIWNLLVKGKIKTFLTDQDILQIYAQYIGHQKDKLLSQQKAKKTVSK